MGLKENFNQAMKELLNKGGLTGSEMAQKARAKSDLDSYLDMPASSPTDARTTPRSSSADGLFDQDTADINLNMSDTDWDSPSYESHTASPPSYRPTPSNYTPESDFAIMYRQAEEMTTISKNTLVVGDIKTLANITIEGSVRGQVAALKDANIRGMLVGDLTCNNSDIKGSSIQGNVTTKGSTYIDNDSVLLGDINAQFASIDGKVKGNIEIGSKIELRQNAIVAGNINTTTISIEDGANIRGYVNTAFLKEQGDSAFPKQFVINTDTAE